MTAQASSTASTEMFWLGLVLFLGGLGMIWAGRRGWRGQYGEPWQSMGPPYQTFWGAGFLAVPGGIIWSYGGAGLLLIAATGNDTSGLAGWIWGIPFASTAFVWFVLLLTYLFIGLPDRWLPPHQRSDQRQPRPKRRGRRR